MGPGLLSNGSTSLKCSTPKTLDASPAQSGKREWPLANLRTMVSDESATSSQTMSPRGTMMERTSCAPTA
ncbi:hypothetical protein D3C77_813020 [compost metagenome]